MKAAIGIYDEEKKLIGYKGDKLWHLSMQPPKLEKLTDDNRIPRRLIDDLRYAIKYPDAQQQPRLKNGEKLFVGYETPSEEVSAPVLTHLVEKGEIIELDEPDVSAGILPNKFFDRAISRYSISNTQLHDTGNIYSVGVFYANIYFDDQVVGNFTSCDNPDDFLIEWSNADAEQIFTRSIKPFFIEEKATTQFCELLLDLYELLIEHDAKPRRAFRYTGKGYVAGGKTVNAGFLTLDAVPRIMRKENLNFVIVYDGKKFYSFGDPRAVGESLEI